MEQLVSITCIILMLSLARVHVTTCSKTESPVVGILVQDYLGDFKSYRFKKTFISATYVKFVESSGARVVPIFTERSQAYYDRILNQVNGVLLPGGDQDTMNSSYTQATRTIYRHAIQSSQRGVYFPVWATCQGFEVLAYLTQGQFQLQSCTANDYATPIHFSIGISELRQTKMFRTLSSLQHKQMSENPVVFQWHNLCLMKETFLHSEQLTRGFRILATNQDRDGKEYVSVMESQQFPIYAVMFHPEEVMFSFVIKPNHTAVPHHAHALNTAQYFSNFFADECRKNSNHMSPETLQRLIIYNYAAEHTIDSGEPYDLSYFFDKSHDSLLFADRFGQNSDLDRE